jgi:hypothetical protein
MQLKKKTGSVIQFLYLSIRICLKMSRTQNTDNLNLMSGEKVLLPVLTKPVTGKKYAAHLIYFTPHSFI